LRLAVLEARPVGVADRQFHQHGSHRAEVELVDPPGPGAVPRDLPAEQEQPDVGISTHGVSNEVFDGLDLDWLRGKPGAKWRHHAGSDVLPAWVADMDFATPDPVRAALHELVDAGDLGYPGWFTGSPLRAAFAERMARRFGWELDPDHVRETNEVVQGAQL